jgi:hypothetical protein
MTPDKVFKFAEIELEGNMSWKSTSPFYLMAALNIPAMKRPKTPGKFSAKAIT